MVEVMFNGPEGRIEGRYTPGKEKNSPAVLVLHPHPLHGGTMNNKVVYCMYQTFVKMGFHALRYNSRGVGRSQGQFDNGIGELTDAATALDWLQLQAPMAKTYWIAGFSFGSWISLQLLMRRPELQNFAAISPPANKYDFSFLSPCPAPGIIVQGDQDSIVSEESVADLASRLNKVRHINVDYRVVHGADHFFREKLDDLSSILEEYIYSVLTEERPKKVKIDRRKRRSLIESDEEFE